MRTLPLLILLIWLASPATSQAELRIIGVLVTKDSQSKTRISIDSDVQKENKTNVTVRDVIPVLRDAKNGDSSVKVGVLVRDVGYRATFREDGAVVEADPAVIR